MAATKRVFDTFELFELILIKVDIKTLLLAQRVNPHWQGTILKSTRLQKKLFFTAATSKDLPLLQIADPDPNSFTMLVSKDTFGAATKDKLGVAGIPASDYVQVNPFYTFVRSSGPIILHAPPREQSRSIGATRSTGCPGPSGSRPRIRLPATITPAPPTSGRARPSWLRMLITQPPASGLSGGPMSFSRLAKTERDALLLDLFGSRDYIVVDGIVMKGRYYWDAVKRNAELSSKKGE